MYAFIKGQLASSSPLKIVIDAGGIGFSIFIPANVYGKLPQVGSSVFLHTSYIVRELSHTLYGFLTTSERDLFETFMDVTGIGPKLALSLIGHLSIIDLQRAIANHDIVTICKVPGIGKKTAERLVIELRDKITNIAVADGSDVTLAVVKDPKAQTISDAMSALINLGYTQQIAQKAIKKTMSDNPEPIDLSSLITLSLKNV